MSGQVIYRQINKDYAYWIEKTTPGPAKRGKCVWSADADA